MEVTPRFAGAAKYLQEVKQMLDRLQPQVETFSCALHDAFLGGRTVFLVGNGGSASNASHFGQDLNKGTLANLEATKRFRAIALTDNVSFITALANDHGYDCIFEQQLRTLGRPGDVLVAISGSGNSPNILRAVEYANRAEIKTLVVTGFDGGRLKQIASAGVHVQSNDMGLVEAVHSVLFHLTMTDLKCRLARDAVQSG